MSDSISTSSAPKPVGSYPHARRVGNLLFLSGVGPRVAGSGDGDSEVPGLELSPKGEVLKFDFEEVSELSNTIRGSGGFGSTGK